MRLSQAMLLLHSKKAKILWKSIVKICQYPTLFTALKLQM